MAALAGEISGGTTCSAPRWPDSFQQRLRLWALIETLNADLLASRSATKTLTRWCADHHMAATPAIIAHRERKIVKPISAAQRQLLEIGPHEPVAYRRVELICGGHILSEADNWYVPARLTPAMNAALDATDLPFGRVVAPLHISRRTVAVRMLWRPLPPGWEMTPQPRGPSKRALAVPMGLFEHRAVVYGGDSKPIAAVIETYRSDLLNFPRQR